MNKILLLIFVLLLPGCAYPYYYPPTKTIWIKGTQIYDEPLPCNRITRMRNDFHGTITYHKEIICFINEHWIILGDQL